MKNSFYCIQKYNAVLLDFPTVSAEMSYSVELPCSFNIGFCFEEVGYFLFYLMFFFIVQLNEGLALNKIGLSDD